jgi:thioredoxin-dependent peroxiredoxin
MLKAGDKAPDFKVKSDEGQDVSLSDFRGKRVILFFFPKANTSG